MVKTSVVNLNNPNILTVNNDTTIGEDSTDLMVVDSNAEFSNNVDVGTDLVVSKTISAKNVNVVGDVDIQGKIKGDVVIGEVSTDTIVINSGIIGSNENIVYGDLWNQLGQDIDGEEAHNNSGYSVSLSSDGTIVAIGAPFNNGNNSGHVRVYQYSSDNGWTQLGQDIEGEASSDRSGRPVSLSSDGTIVAIGAWYNDGNGGVDSGHVRVYQYSSDVGWTQLGQDIDGEADSDESGTSVSLSSDGTIVAIGAYKNDNDNGTNSGHVRVYQWRKYTDSDSGVYHHTTRIQDSTQTKPLIITGYTTIDGNIEGIQPTAGNYYWTQLGEDIDGEAAYDRSGRSVSLSSDGTIVAIGAYINDNDNGTDSGHVRVYQYDATKTTNVTNQTSSDFGPIGWRRLGQDIDGEAAYDSSGFSISLSSDGTIVAIGSSHNDNDNGIDSGHVRVYQYSSDDNNWTQLGLDIEGEAADDLSGYSVSLSSDGTIVAIGAYFNDNDNGTNSGHVRVYKIDTNPSLYINSYVGIGTIDPSYNLDLYDGNFRLLHRNDTTVYNNFLTFERSLTDDCRINHYCDNKVSAQIEFDGFSTLEQSMIKFSTKENNDSSLNTRMVIGYNGITTVNGTFTNNSDDRLKYRETKILNSLNLINKIKPYKYEKTTINVSNDEWEILRDENDYTIEFGVIAQDLKQIQELSFASVYNQETDTWSVSYNNLNVLNIAGIQEIDRRVVSHFTGSHTCYPENESLNYNNYIGLIVVSNGSYKIKRNDNIFTGKQAIRIDHSTPQIRLSNVDNQKSILGVVSLVQDDTVLINSSGEGGIWVCNKNGNLENGDYISSSSVVGYGQKQILQEGTLKNYTVAKITCDVDFNFTNNFETRFLQADGTQITEEEYNTKKTEEEEVYLACFVGCTYHCG